MPPTPTCNAFANRNLDPVYGGLGRAGVHIKTTLLCVYPSVCVGTFCGKKAPHILIQWLIVGKKWIKGGQFFPEKSVIITVCFLLVGQTTLARRAPRSALASSARKCNDYTMVIHLVKPGTKLSTLCPANHGKNRKRRVVLTGLKSNVTCLSCRSHIAPWERGSK